MATKKEKDLEQEAADAALAEKNSLAQHSSPFQAGDELKKDSDARKQVEADRKKAAS